MQASRVRCVDLVLVSRQGVSVMDYTRVLFSHSRRVGDFFATQKQRCSRAR